MAVEKKVGTVEHYFPKIGVGAIVLRVSDHIHVRGTATDFEQEVTSMQINLNSVDTANPGDDVGIKLDQEARKGDEVFLVG
jgi:U32 family peptidase